MALRMCSRSTNDVSVVLGLKELMNKASFSLSKISLNYLRDADGHHDDLAR